MNSTDVVRTQVRRDAKTLLDTVGVSRVVIVDDEYADRIEELLGICSVLTTPGARALPHLRGVDFDAPREVWTAEVREVWQTLDDSQRSDMLAEETQVGCGHDCQVGRGRHRQQSGRRWLRRR